MSTDTADATRVFRGSVQMAKADQQDIDQAGNAMSYLDAISRGWYPVSDDDGDHVGPEFFDEDNPDHLRRFYDLMHATLEKSPGWPGRVIGGMCFVVLYDENRIVDPDAHTLQIHPRFNPQTAEQFQAAAQDLAERARAAGFVLAIEQKAAAPLAQGNHTDVATVRRSLESIRKSEVQPCAN